jgi:plasmid stabilization system protein ParE
MLLRHPHSGQATNKPPARRITTAPYTFVIFYKIDDKEIIIVGVRHAAREPEPPRG